MGNGLKSRVKGQEILVFPQTHERKKKKKKSTSSRDTLGVQESTRTNKTKLSF